MHRFETRPAASVERSSRDKAGKPFLVPKHWKLELSVMDILGDGAALSTREVMERFPDNARPPYFTVRSTLERLQSKKVIRHVRTVAGAQIFQAAVNAGTLRDLLLDEFAELFTDDIGAAFARLIHTGRLTRDDLIELQALATAELARPIEG